MLSAAKNEGVKCPIYALKVYTRKRPDSRRARDEKQPEAAEESKETNAPGADTGSRSATEEIKSSGAVGLTRGEQERGSRDERRACQLQISYLERL